MILDTIANLELYRSVHPALYESLQYLRRLDAIPPEGAHEINERVRAIVASYRTSETNDGIYEAHRRFIDVHFPVHGRERIDWSPVSGMTTLEEYDAEKERALYTGPTHRSSVVVGDGVFAILFPGDAHRPGLAADGAELIRKVTLKVSLV